MKKNMDLEVTEVKEVKEVKEEAKPWKPDLNNKSLAGWLPIILATIISITIVTSGMMAHAGHNKAIQTAEAAEQPPIKVTAVSVNQPKDKAPDTGGGDETEEKDEGWHYYNTDLQDDGIKDNDYNFGPNPVTGTPEALEKLTKAIERKGLKDSITMEEIAGDVSPEAIDKDFRERLRKDPALGAACMAWADSVLGTRYLGVFYTEAKEQWDVAMNLSKEKFIEDKDLYNKTLDAFFKYLDSADEVKIDKQASGLNDQMYMNPFTVDEVPDIIVMESADHAGWFLIYHFTIKQTAKKEIKYRLDCGYQPTNVAKVMKLKAKKNPNKKTTVKPTTKITGGGAAPVAPTPTPTVIVGGGTTGGSTPNPNPPRPNPNPPKPDPIKPDPFNPDPIKPIDPIPTPPKDPTEGTNVLPNDDPGPGPDTNNPDDPNHSIADLPTNSDHMTPGEYDDAMNENREANESREAGDSNTPSTPPPTENTNVDNNADNGTGHGGIDKPTDVSDSSVGHDSPGSHWDGPPD